MYSSRTGKFYNILQIDGDDAITPELIELMKNYDGVKFTCPTFHQSVDCIPGNVKFIDMSAIQSYKHTFTNLPASLIGIAFPANFPANNSLNDFSFIPYGLKIVYFASNFVNWGMSILMSELPPSVEYIVFKDKIHIVGMTYLEVKKILTNDIHSVKSHIIFDIPFDYKYKYPIGY